MFPGSLVVLALTSAGEEFDAGAVLVIVAVVVVNFSYVNAVHAFLSKM